MGDDTTRVLMRALAIVIVAGIVVLGGAVGYRYGVRAGLKVCASEVLP